MRTGIAAKAVCLLVWAGAMFASSASSAELALGRHFSDNMVLQRDKPVVVSGTAGAGAAVLQAGGEGRGIMKSVMGCDGSLANLLWTPGGGSRNPASHEMIDQRQQYLKMQGREVFKHAVVRMTEAVVQALEKNSVDVGDIKCFIPHQANVRIIDAIAKRLDIAGRVYTNVEKYANTSSAALAIALDEAAKDGTIQQGDLVAMTVFGGGFTWGANVLEWSKS